MVTFNSYQLRKDEAGKTFLDLEVTLRFHPQLTIMRFSFPATEDHKPCGDQLTNCEDQKLFDHNSSGKLTQ